MGKTARARGPVLDFSVKKLKEWQGMDGYGCHGEIHHKTNGLVARFRDEGSGGGMMVEPSNYEDKDHYNHFYIWGNKHPVLDLVWKQWGFKPDHPNGNHLDVLVEWLIVEHRIDKEIRKGYLCYQLPDEGPLTYCTAKTGRKKTKYSFFSESWLTEAESTAICRNVQDPDYITCKEQQA